MGKELKCFIEYQGIQHYEYNDCGWNTRKHYYETIKRDSEKRNICAFLNIPLYEIPCWESIDEYLNKILKTYNII